MGVVFIHDIVIFNSTQTGGVENNNVMYTEGNCMHTAQIDDCNKLYEMVASHSTDPSVSPFVEVVSHLYLVIPQKGAHETHFMTLGNYKQLVPKFKQSFLFQFDANTFNKCLGTHYD